MLHCVRNLITCMTQLMIRHRSTDSGTTVDEMKVPSTKIQVSKGSSGVYSIFIHHGNRRPLCMQKTARRTHPCIAALGFL